MSSLSCLFLVQGEGRGHLTQALALRTLLAEAGHRVTAVLVGRSPRRDIPGFFLRKIDAPVAFLDSPNFAYDGRHRAIRWGRTLREGVRRLPRLYRSLQAIDAHVKRHRPDVIVNFYEPLGGLFAAVRRPAVPMVCIAHQYVYLHPMHRFPPGRRLHRAAILGFTRLTALGATRRLALSLYPAPDGAEGPVTVLPPLLRDELFRQPLGREEPFLLAYLLNQGYAEEIIRWHERHPDVRLHCFWDRPGAAPVEQHDATLAFHRLDDEEFLGLMARCRGLLTTAGFESVGEAMYLGKPVLAVPVEGHFEQYCNSLDVEKAGAGMAADRFDVDAFLRFLPAFRSPATPFRRWLAEGRQQFVRAIEAAARQHPAPPARLAPA